MAREIKLNVNIDGLDKPIQQSKSLKAELRELKDQLVLLPQGDEFNKIAAQAAELEDKIGDVNQKVKALASDTTKLDAFADGVKGIAAGFAVAQGAAALFGAENEDVQKTILKVQAATSILLGVQELSNLATGNGVLKMAALSAAQTIYNVVVGTSVGALKAFRIALAATGAGAILAGLAALVVYWEDIAKFIGISNDNLDKNLEKTDLIIDKLLNELELRKALAQAAGDQVDLQKIEIEGVQKEITERQKYITTQENYLKSNQNASISRIKYANDEIDISKQQILILEAQLIKLNEVNKAGKSDVKEHKKEVARVKNHLDELLKLRVDNMKEGLGKKEAQIELEYFLDVKKAQTDIKDAEMRAKILLELEKRYLRDIQNARDEAEQEALKKKFDADAALALYNKAKRDKEKSDEEEAEDIILAARIERVKGIVEKVQGIATIFNASFQAASDLFSSMSDAKIARIENESNVAISEIDKQIDAAKKQGKSTVELEKKKLQLKYELDKKTYEIQKKQFRVQKALSLGMAIVNTAAGVAGALGSPPFGFPAIAASIAAGIAGAAQIAIIAKSKFTGEAPTPPDFSSLNAIGASVGGDSNGETGPQRRGPTALFGVDSGAVVLGPNGVPISGGPNQPIIIQNNIVESDITNVQDRINTIRNRAAIIE